MPSENIVKDNIKSPAALAIIFIKTQPLLVTSNHDIFQFTGKYYELVDDFEMSRKVHKFYKDNNCIAFWRPGKSDEIIKSIKYDDMVNAVKFDDYDNMLNFKNGILNLDTMKFIAHSPEYYFSYCINIDYNPENKSAPVFTKFLFDLFTNRDGTVDKETVFNLIQIGGYLMYPKNKMEKLFMFIGDGANGKSVLIETYKMFFDRRFISSLSLTALSDEESFTRSSLIDSRLNISTEQKGGDIDPEEIKKIVSGEDITVKRKFKEAVNFKPNCKVLVASNNLPYLNDVTHGSGRRLFLIDFKNRFVSPAEYAKIETPAKKGIFPAANKEDLINDIKAEAPAILNLYLEGLLTLRSNNWIISETKNSEIIKEEYQESSDTLGVWLQNNYRLIEESDGDLIKKFASHPSVDKIYNEFRDWYEYNLPGKKFNYSKILLSKRIKDKFRVDVKRVWEYDEQLDMKKYACKYPLLRLIETYDESTGQGFADAEGGAEAVQTELPGGQGGLALPQDLGSVEGQADAAA